jgi:head-tail adaptor
VKVFVVILLLSHLNVWAKGKEVPDPGEEGKKTLLGIDSDKDGVRDDVQIWINQQYSKSSNINNALRQQAKYDQLKIKHHNDKEESCILSHKVLGSISMPGFLLR